MAESKKGRKVGRSKRNGQATRYKNERRREQNKLRRLRRYVTQRGVPGQDVVDAIHRCETVLGQLPLSKLVVVKSRRRAQQKAA